MHHHEKLHATLFIKEHLKTNRASSTTTFHQKTTSIYHKMSLSLHTLPVELVYRILDQLNDKALFVSCSNVCARLNNIINTYHRYQVIIDFTMKLHFHHIFQAYNSFHEYIQVYYIYDGRAIEGEFWFWLGLDLGLGSKCRWRATVAGAFVRGASVIEPSLYI